MSNALDGERDRPLNDPGPHADVGEPRTTLVLRRQALCGMRAHALAEYPHECCGAIIGTTAGPIRQVLEVMPINNVTEVDRRRRFSIAPADYLKAERRAAALGMELLGFYHSHPDHPARPSQTDRAFAQPGFSYPILAVNGLGSAEVAIGDVTSWLLSGGDAWYRQEELLVDRDDGQPAIAIGTAGNPCPEPEGWPIEGAGT